MTILRFILGGIAALVLAMSASAQAPTAENRPLSREDAANLRQAAEMARWQEARPLARPVWMLRYPVVVQTGDPGLRPRARDIYMPQTRWDHRPGSESWTWVAMSALASHGSRLEQTVPRDIATWCPGYEANSPRMRRAFWVGMMSALAFYESTWRPEAVGGGDLWYGLLQIYPDTARRYGCRATTGEALKDPEDNLSCAIRIMNVTVPRDNAIAVHNGRWRGVAADWGPMTNRAKIARMAAWTREQAYCEAETELAQSRRPRARPAGLATVSVFDQG